MEVAQGPVVYFCAEDDIDEVTNRLNEICEAESIDLAQAWQLHILPMVGKDTVLAKEKDGQLVETQVYGRLCATLEDIAPELLILDNLADVFGGNENSRTQSKQFISKLRGLCLRFDCTVLLIGHPSLTGRSSGTGESGSTGWGNSVRVRCYLHRLEGPDADDNARVFEIKKANYAASGTRLNLLWQAHRFIITDPPNILDAVTADEVEKVKQMFGTGRWRVKEQSDDWGGHAVAQVLDLDVGRGIGAKERSGEQNKNRETIRRLINLWLRAKSIFIIDGTDSYRRPSKFFTNRDPEQET
jgi:RecA-family ATPase